MNDTFDFLTFSNITTNCGIHSSSQKQEESIKKNINDISFDDSLFLNSQEFTVLREEDKNCEPEAEKPHKSVSDFDSKTISSSDNSNTLNDTFSDTRNVSVDVNNSVNDIFDSEQTESSEILKLSAWGLPDSILSKYSSRNINTMFPWQVECLNNPKVLKNYGNLVYSAPTSAGKTLVAEILAIKTILERSKKVIFILPFVSVVREKMFYFQDIFSGSGIRVEGYMGGYHPPGGFKSIEFAVCTIEKANNLINNFLQEGTLSEIGAIIIDEMHLLGESHRGYILELLLTKLRYISIKDSNVKIQIIGMSATLPNLKTLSKWLDAELYITNFRPIPLYEQALISSTIYDVNFTQVRMLKPLPELETDTDHILQLCLETITSNCSVLIFCPTKNWCENLAQQISIAFYKLGSGGSNLGAELRRQLDSHLISELLEQLKTCPVGLDEVLRKTVSFGVAFHHAGLTLDERDIIEGAFRNNTLRILVATSTLSSGVNLPARRVIIRSPIFHGKSLDSLTYRQMIGRAGRMGRDTSGESILVCQKNEEKFARSLMTEELPPIESCLEGEGKLKRAILEIVTSGVASTQDDVQLFTKCTLLAQNEALDNLNPIEEALDFLLKNEFLTLHDDKYFATDLAKACLSSSLPPEEGLALFSELEKARQCFVLDSELHLVYLVTPYSACHQWGNIDWMLFLSLWEKLPSCMKRVGELVGVRESYIVSATRGKIQTNTSKLYRKLLIHKRFFVALALHDLVEERPLSEVCSKFNCNRGMLQTLQLTAATFAGMVTSFSRQLKWSNVEILVSQFQDRLNFGISRDLLDLMKLPILNSKSARALFDGGLENLIQIANSDVNTIEAILHKVNPFESAKLRDGESEHALKERNKLKNIWIIGKEGLTEREAAELILTSSREYLRIEMGLKEAKWDQIKPMSVTAMSDSLFSISDTSLFEETKTSLNSSDFITTSQDETFKTPRKRIGSILIEESPLKKCKTLNFSQNIEEFEIVDVCNNDHLFQTFCKEAKTQKYFALAIACSEAQEQKRRIGLTPIILQKEAFTYKNIKIEGIAICWDKRTSFYLDLSKNNKIINFIQNLISTDVSVTMFEAKEQIKLMKRCLGLNFKAKLEDPKIADWILEPEGREKSLQAMVNVYTPHLSKLSQLCGLIKRGSFALDVTNAVSPKQRSSLETVLTINLNEVLKKKLFLSNFDEVYEIENSCLKILATTELIGISTDQNLLSKLVQTLNQQQLNLEKKAYTLAGRRFSFLSAKEVSKILGLRKSNTRKQILEKSENPIANLVLRWRKIHSIVTKTIQPLLRCVENGRIHGCYITHTATGRITMNEPNVQNVAKNFELDGLTISCRDAFIVDSNKVLVSADYCQLELRLLAHLSQDDVLCKIMKKEGDVFKSVASKWNRIKEDEVSDDLRQKAKQISYGIIYGMGSKALAEQLHVEEEEASIFMETFKNAYPGVQDYIKKVVEKCRKNGFVETLGGRRRYLSHINHRSLAVRSQAERQAVNTTIQGSAADIVKKSMIVLEGIFERMEDLPKLVLHLHDELIYEVSSTNLRSFAEILKQTMEAAVNLSIPFPVKIKSGSSWGQLTEYKL